MSKVVYSTKKSKRYIVQRCSELFGAEVCMEWGTHNFKWVAILDAKWAAGSKVNTEYRVIDTKED